MITINVDDEREAFYRSIDQRRRALRMTWRQVCEVAGVDQNIPTRLGRHQSVMGDSLLRLSAWLRATKAGLPAVSGSGYKIQAGASL